MRKKKETGQPARTSRYEDRDKLRNEPKYEDGIASYIQKMKFKKQTIGGVDEADVWRKIKGLSDRYEALLAWSDEQETGEDSASTGKGSRSQPAQAIREKRRRIADVRQVISFLVRLAALAVFLWIMLYVVFGLAVMPNNDMMPRISSGDLLLYYRLDDGYSSGDIVVFERDGIEAVGRVVAKPGDNVEIGTESGLYVNGSQVVENNIYYSTRAYDNDVEYPVKLAEDEIFVLGDYRDGAKDSRVYGPISKSEVKGEVIAVLRRSTL